MARRRVVCVLLSALFFFGTWSSAAPPALDDPLIKGLSPAQAQAGGQVLITGVNFGNAPEVRFDGQLASVDAHRPDLGRLVATVPAGTSIGEVTVTVTDTGAAKTSNSAGFTVLAGSFVATCTISGTVSDAASAPLPGALVLGIEPTRGVFASLAITNGAGSYSLGLDPAGEYDVVFLPPAGSTLAEGSANSACTGVLDHQLATGHLLTGRAVSATAAPIENARVLASDSVNFHADVLSQAAGTFSQRVPAGEYEVLVEGPVGGRHVARFFESVTVGSDTDLGDITLADGVLVEGSIELQDDTDPTVAMNAFLAEFDLDGTLSGATSSIADGTFYLPSPGSGRYSLWISSERRDVETLAVLWLDVTGDMALQAPLRLFTRAGQLPWRPALISTPSLEVQVGQRIVFDAAALRGSSVSFLFSDGLGGLVAGLETLAEMDRGAVVTTVPPLAETGEVILRVDGVDSPGYPLTINSGTFDPGPFTTSGIVDDSVTPVENVFVAILAPDCGEDRLLDYDLTAADGSYSVEHGSGDHLLVFLPPASSGLASAFHPLPGLSGGGTVDLSLAAGHAVTARCVDSGLGVVGGSAPVPDCLVAFDGQTLDFDDDARADDNANMRLNVPTGSYEIDLLSPPGSRFLDDVGGEETITEDTDFGDVTIDSGYLITGRITDPLGGGLAGVEVYAFQTPGWDVVSRTDSVGADGWFSVAVPPGTYDLYFEVHRDLDYFVAPVYGIDVSSDISVYPAIEGHEVGFIRGSVTDLSLAPIGEVPIKAWHSTYGVVDEQPSCDDGSYSLRAPTGDFTIQARPTAQDLCLADEYYDNHFAGCGADTVSVTAPTPIAGIDFRLDPAGSVSGSLSDDGGSPVEGATVCASAGDTLSFCVETCTLSSADGSYSIAGIPVGDDYKIQSFGSGLPTKCWQDHVNCLTYDPVAVAECLDTPGIDLLISPAPGPVPDGGQVPGTMMTAAYEKGSDTLTVDWQPTCNADNHALYIGALGNFAGYTSAECAIGVTGSHGLNPPPGNLFFLVVGLNETREGSYGVDSSLGERASDGGVFCGYTQDLSASCVP